MTWTSRDMEPLSTASNFRQFQVVRTIVHLQRVNSVSLTQTHSDDDDDDLDSSSSSSSNVLLIIMH